VGNPRQKTLGDKVAEIRIPFLKEFEQSILDGNKTMTCRTRKVGEVGDTFPVADVMFEIRRIFKPKLSDVEEKYWAPEGCKSPNQFRVIWKKIHPRRRWRPEQIVWAHEFGRLGA